jgi:hypothetical protein
MYVCMYVCVCVNVCVCVCMYVYYAIYLNVLDLDTSSILSIIPYIILHLDFSRLHHIL